MERPESLVCYFLILFPERRQPIYVVPEIAMKTLRKQRTETGEQKSCAQKARRTKTAGEQKPCHPANSMRAYNFASIVSGSHLRVCERWRSDQSGVPQRSNLVLRHVRTSRSSFEHVPLSNCQIGEGPGKVCSTHIS